MSDDNATTPDQSVIDALTPPSDPPAPSSDLTTIKVDGKEMQVTKDKLVELAQKSAHAQNLASQQGQQISDLQKKADIANKLEKFREDPLNNTQAYREAMLDLGYDATEVEAEIAAVTSIQQQQQTQQPPGQTPSDQNEELVTLRNQVQEMRHLLIGRENDILKTTIENGLTSDPYVKSSLEGVEDSAKDARLRMLAAEALTAAENELQKRRERNPSFQYDPEAAREIAGLATEQAVKLAKAIGLNAPTQPGRDVMSDAGLGTKIELPEQPTITTDLAGLRSFVSKSLAQGLQESRLGRKQAGTV